MPNPTSMVLQVVRRADDTKTKVLLPPTPDTYYPNELMGRRASDGFAVHFDDTQALTFLGFFEGPRFFITSDLPTAALVREVNRPARFTMPLAVGVTASKLTDIGKAVYALDSGHVTMNPALTSFANYVGTIDDILTATPEGMTSNNVWIIPATGAGRTSGASRLNVGPAPADVWAAAIAINVGSSSHILAASFTTSAVATLTPSGPGNAGDLLIILTEADASGSVTVTFASTFHPSATQVTAASRFSSCLFQSDGTRWIELCRTTSVA